MARAREALQSCEHGLEGGREFVWKALNDTQSDWTIVNEFAHPCRQATESLLPNGMHCDVSWNVSSRRLKSLCLYLYLQLILGPRSNFLRCFERTCNEHTTISSSVLIELRTGGEELWIICLTYNNTKQGCDLRFTYMYTRNRVIRASRALFLKYFTCSLPRAR